MRNFLLWLRRFCIASLDLNCSFQRRNTALTILDAMAAKLTAVWPSIGGCAFMWQDAEIGQLLALFRDAFDINRLAAFNLLQRVPWTLEAKPELAALIQQSADGTIDALALAQGEQAAAPPSDMAPDAPALLRLGFRATSQMSHAASNSGALMLALLFAQGVQERQADRLPAVLGRSEKMSYLQKTVENTSMALEDIDAAREAVFVRMMLRVLESRVSVVRLYFFFVQSHRREHVAIGVAVTPHHFFRRAPGVQIGRPACHWTLPSAWNLGGCAPLHSPGVFCNSGACGGVHASRCRHGGIASYPFRLPVLPQSDVQLELVSLLERVVAVSFPIVSMAAPEG